MGIDATNKMPGETTRPWGRPIVMDPAVKARVDSGPNSACERAVRLPGGTPR